MALDLMRSQDLRGLDLSGVTPAQAQRYDAILIDTYHYVPGTVSELDTLLSEAPDFVLGHVMRGYGTMTDGFYSATPDARFFWTKPLR